MSPTYRCLVIENDPTDDARRLGDWLTGSGLELQVCRPYQGDAVPAELDGYAALLVLGGEQHAYPDPDGSRSAPWLPALEALLRRAVRAEVPTLAVCLGAQLLATAHNGLVEPSPAGPEVGVALVAKRDSAERDPIFAAVPMLPDVIQWHLDEITELPPRAVLLFASTSYPHQAFRLGPCAWGVQFHLECDTAMIADWASTEDGALAAAGLTPEQVVAQADAHMDDLFEVWHPFAHRFAAVARGELAAAEAVPPERELPLLSPQLPASPRPDH